MKAKSNEKWKAAKNFLICVIALSSAQQVFADNYGGFGIGVSEACKTNSEPSFSGGDCIHRDLAIRGFVGVDLSDYFAIETTADFAFDGGNVAETVLSMILSDSTDGTLNYNNQSGYQTTGRWSVFNIGASAFAKLPIGREIVFFAGPSVGAAYTEVDTGVKYFDNQQQNFRDTTYGFGTNYGFSVGMDLFLARDSAFRFQWQNIRSLDSNAANDGHFSSNTFTINFRVNY